MSPTAALTDRAAAREAAEAHLRALVGPREGQPEARLREDQWSAIEALAVDRRRALVVQRTGWGKSAVYFVATLLLRGAGAGPTVIVSPLLALMRNQITAAERAGIRAVTINSTNAEDWEPIHEQIAAGEVDGPDDGRRVGVGQSYRTVLVPRHGGRPATASVTDRVLGGVGGDHRPILACVWAVARPPCRRSLGHP